MDADWTYSTSIALADSGTPSLELEASTDVPLGRGRNTTFATPQLALNLQVSLDSQEIPSRDLQGSALVREMIDWLAKNKGAIGVDAIGHPVLTNDGFTIPLHAATRSARSQALIIDSASFAPTSLSYINLKLDFSSPDHPASSQTAPQGGSQDGLLVNQLIAPYPQPLHFTLAPLLDQALSKLVKNLAKWFPICFNPFWVDRITNDLTSHHSIAKSLSNILSTSALIDTGQLSLEEISKARRLQQELVPYFSTTPQAVNTISAAQTYSLPSYSFTETTMIESECIEKGLLVLAKQLHLVDPLNLPTSSPTTRFNGYSNSGGLGKGGAGGGSRGKGRDGKSSASSKGKGKGKGQGKRKKTEQEDDLILDEEEEEDGREGEAQSMKRVKRNREGEWEGEIEEEDTIFASLEEDENGLLDEGDYPGFFGSILGDGTLEEEEMLIDERENSEEEGLLEL